MLSQWNVGFIFLDLWLLLEMSDEVIVFSSFRSSFRLSGSFSRIGALVFSETQLGVNGSAWVDKANSFLAEMAKNSKK